MPDATDKFSLMPDHVTSQDRLREDARLPLEVVSGVEVMVGARICGEQLKEGLRLIMADEQLTSHGPVHVGGGRCPLSGGVLRRVFGGEKDERGKVSVEARAEVDGRKMICPRRRRLNCTPRRPNSPPPSPT
ncbi:hypothetical protein [Nonomuraea sp. NPDC049784]|uniref:hypothetical protein n=1 Tax=Nonomuraea sp. NPDC049784 TaxID=3154361 RepID=UPI0033DBC7C7